MFRKGGPTNNMNGIMTGIVDRENHAVSDPNGVGGQTAMDYINRIIPTEAEMSAFRERMPRQKETSGLDDPLTSFLLSYGPALATATPTGGIIGTAVGAAKEPIANLLKDVKEKKQLDYVTESDAFKTLLEVSAGRHVGASDAADDGRPHGGARFPVRDRRPVHPGARGVLRGHHRVRHEQPVPPHAHPRGGSAGPDAPRLDPLLPDAGQLLPAAQGEGGGRLRRARVLPAVPLVRDGLQGRHGRHLLHRPATLPVHGPHPVLPVPAPGARSD